MKCPNCQNSDESMIEQLMPNKYFCKVCSKSFIIKLDDKKEKKDET